MTVPRRGARQGPEDAILAVTVVPRAAKAGMERTADGALRVRIAAAPAAGAANQALLRFLADALHLPRSRLAIISGSAGRRKRIGVAGVSRDDLDARVRAALRRQVPDASVSGQGGA